MKRSTKTFFAVLAALAVVVLFWALSQEDSYVNTYRQEDLDRERIMELDIEREVPRRTSNPISPRRPSSVLGEPAGEGTSANESGATDETSSPENEGVDDAAE